MRQSNFIRRQGAQKISAQLGAKGYTLTALRVSLRWLSGRLRRALSGACNLSVALSLLATSTPATTLVVSGVFQQWHADLSSWVANGNLGVRLRRFQGLQNSSAGQERQEDRDARVTHLRIHPSDVTIHLGEAVRFSGVGHDDQETPIGGVQFTWSAEDSNQNPVFITVRGGFRPTMPGIFKVRAEAGGKKAETRVTVLDDAHRNNSDQLQTTTVPGPIQYSPLSSSRTPARREPTRRGPNEARTAKISFHPSPVYPTASSPPLMQNGRCGDAYSWNNCNYSAAYDPGNSRGHPLGHQIDQGAGNGNFQLAAPVLAEPGRGINVSLGLAYNSRLWTRYTAGSQLIYNIDHEWPAPGWSLGFGKINLLSLNQGAIIIDADGTRHNYTGSISIDSDQSYSSFVGHTTDGTFIDYSYTTGLQGTIQTAQAKYPNGTVVQYGAGSSSTLAAYPTQIEDVNGNYITITYVNNQGPQIQTITDTLGRPITFYYDITGNPTNGLLTAITGPGLNGATRTLVRINYRQLPAPISTTFSGTTAMISNPNPWLVNAIYYPATGTGYWFGDSDSYSPYGMTAKVLEERGMSFTTSTNSPLQEQGTVTQGTMSKEQVYAYQTTTPTDSPTFTSVTETWDSMNTAPVITSFAVSPNATPRTATITLPNGTKSIQYSYNHPPVNGAPQYDDGLIYYDETRDANNNLLQSSTTNWQQGDYSSPRPANVSSEADKESEVRDSSEVV